MIDGTDLIDELKKREYGVGDHSQNEYIAYANKERKEEGLTFDELGKDGTGSELPSGKIYSPFTNPPRVLDHPHDSPPRYLTPIQKGDSATGFSRMSKQERRLYAVANGTRVSYLSCPMCGRSRSMKAISKEGRLGCAFGELDAENNTFVPYAERILQWRVGGGRQIGFFLIPEDSVSLAGLFEAEPVIFQNIRSIAQKIVDMCNDIEKEPI